MKRITIIFILFTLMACGVDDATKISVKPAPDDYSISQDGKIATVSTSTGFKKMLADGSISEIKLNSGSYSEEYELNIPKRISGSKNTKINKLSINSDGSKIDSPVISTLLAGRGIGNGNLELRNVTIKKDAIFEGGGSNSIRIFGKSTFEGAVVLNKPGLSLKMGGETNMTNSIVILQPASLLGNDEDINKEVPNIAADILVNYSTLSNFTTTINVKVNNLVVCEKVANVALGEEAEVESLLNLGNLEITNSGDKIKNQNAELTAQLLNMIILSKLNNGDITENFILPINISSIPITWTSLQPLVIDVDGENARVTRPITTTAVSLIASFTLGEKLTKEFMVKVIGKDKILYTVRFDSGTDLKAESFPTSMVITYPITSIVAFPSNPEKSDFTFDGWFTEKDGKGIKLTTSTKVESNLTVYANWISIPVFTVTFNVDSGTAIDSQSIQENGKATRPANPTKTGYIFVNWYSDEAKTTVYDFNTAITSAITIYAKWTANIYRVI